MREIASPPAYGRARTKDRADNLERSRLFDLVARVARDPFDAESEEWSIALPLAYLTPGSACEAFAIVAKHLELEEAKLLVEVGDDLHLAVLARGEGARLLPVRLECADAGVEALLRASDVPREALRRPAPADDSWVASERDESRPFTTGSIESRKEAVYAYLYPRNGSKPTAEDVASAEAAFPALVAALHAAENAGDDAASFRQLVYEHIGTFARTSDEALGVRLQGLEHEPDELRAVIYLELSHYDDPRAAAALVRGYKNEPPAVRRQLAHFVWKNQRAIELLIREELVPSWGGDEKWCKRILHLLNEEYIPVSRAWLTGAPPDLVTALGARVSD